MKKNILKKILLFTILALLLVACKKEEKVSTEEILYGRWIAAENQTEDENLYYLSFIEESQFILKSEEETITGKYIVEKNNKIVLSSDSKITCKLNKEELTCNKYAKKFIKMEPAE